MPKGCGVCKWRDLRCWREDPNLSFLWLPLPEEISEGVVEGSVDTMDDEPSVPEPPESVSAIGLLSEIRARLSALTGSARLGVVVLVEKAWFAADLAGPLP